MKLRPIVSSLIAASLLLASTHPVDAQKKRPAGVASLTEMPCQSISGALRLEGINEDIPVGLEIFRAVSVLKTSRYIDVGGIPKQAVQIACRIAQVKEKPKYKTLTLAFAMNDSQSNGSQQIRLSLYKDGKSYGYKDISKGEKLLWQIDVTGTRSLALEVECTRGNGCPVLYFFEDTLK
jgi:hypothetical protein